MRAAVIRRDSDNNKSVLSIEDTDIPVFGEDDVLIKIKAVGLCKTDIEVFAGEHPYTKDEFKKNPKKFHLIPGHEWSGIVHEIGSSCRGLSVGDHVIGETTMCCGTCINCSNGMPELCEDPKEIGINRDGAMAEYLSVPCKIIHKIPKKISFADAAMIEPIAVVIHAADRLLKEIPENGIQDQTIAIFGDGPISLLLFQVLQLKGAKKIIIIGKSSKKLKVAQQLGCKIIVNTSKLSEEESVAHIRKVVKNIRIDVIIDATSNFAYKDSAIVEGVNIVRKQGIILLIGMHHPTQIEVNSIVLKELKIIGAVSSYGVWQEAIKLLSNKKIKTDPLINNILLDNLPKIFYKSVKKPVDIIKGIVSFP
jgi:L-iditol 2-dehydrogenase